MEKREKEFLSLKSRYEILTKKFEGLKSIESLFDANDVKRMLNQIKSDLYVLENHNESKYTLYDWRLKEIETLIVALEKIINDIEAMPDLVKINKIKAQIEALKNKLPTITDAKAKENMEAAIAQAEQTLAELENEPKTETGSTKKPAAKSNARKPKRTPSSRSAKPKTEVEQLKAKIQSMKNSLADMDADGKALVETAIANAEAQLKDLLIIKSPSLQGNVFDIDFTPNYPAISISNPSEGFDILISPETKFLDLNNDVFLKAEDKYNGIEFGKSGNKTFLGLSKQEWRNRLEEAASLIIQEISSPIKEPKKQNRYQWVNYYIFQYLKGDLKQYLSALNEDIFNIFADNQLNRQDRLINPLVFSVGMLQVRYKEQRKYLIGLIRQHKLTANREYKNSDRRDEELELNVGRAYQIEALKMIVDFYESFLRSFIWDFNPNPNNSANDVINLIRKNFPQFSLNFDWNTDKPLTTAKDLEPDVFGTSLTAMVSTNTVDLDELIESGKRLRQLQVPKKPKGGYNGIAYKKDGTKTFFGSTKGEWEKHIENAQTKLADEIKAVKNLIAFPSTRFQAVNSIIAKNIGDAIMQYFKALKKDLSAIFESDKPNSLDDLQNPLNRCIDYLYDTLTDYKKLQKVALSGFKFERKEKSKVNENTTFRQLSEEINDSWDSLTDYAHELEAYSIVVAYFEQLIPIFILRFEPRPENEAEQLLVLIRRNFKQLDSDFDWGITSSESKVSDAECEEYYARVEARRKEREANPPKKKVTPEKIGNSLRSVFKAVTKHNLFKAEDLEEFTKEVNKFYKGLYEYIPLETFKKDLIVPEPAE